MKEKVFEQNVKKWLIENRIYEAGTPKHRMEYPINGWFFKVWGGGFQRAGIPDILCCVQGQFIALELKASTGIPSALQEKNIKMINQAKGIGLILYPEQFNKLKTIIGVVINERRDKGTL